MSDSPLSFEWLPTPLERLSQAEYLMRRPLWRRLARMMGIFILVIAILAAITASTESETRIINWGWAVLWLVWSTALIFRPAVAFPWLDSLPVMSRRLTVDDNGVLVQNLGLRLHPHRTHWSRLSRLEEFQNGYGLYIDGGYSAFWIPRRVLGDRECEFCQFVAAHSSPNGPDS